MVFLFRWIGGEGGGFLPAWMGPRSSSIILDGK